MRHPPDGLSPDEAEARIAGAPNEWMYVYDPDGRQRGRFEGTPNNVDLSTELIAVPDGAPSQSLLRDHLIVHNHPPTLFGRDPVSSYPPSPADLGLAGDRDLRELVVVSDGYRFALRRPEGGWKGDAATYAVALESAGAALDIELGPTGSTAAAAAARQHALLERLRRDGWIEYERTDQDWRSR